MSESDYEKTQRKITPKGDTQYIVGGSRHQNTTTRGDVITKVGVISPGDIMSAMLKDVPPEISRKNMKALDQQGYIDREALKKEGLKFILEDEVDDEATHVYYGNKRYPKTSKLFPGDVIEVIKPHDRRKHGSLARVVHVRNFENYTISASYFEGDYMGLKDILTVDEYKVIRRNDGSIPRDMKRVRTDIVKEDDDNIDKI
tara:strand:+ start:290 stop:892 length:603 start_codon:yes stop_codon:yes gene_type:complete